MLYQWIREINQRLLYGEPFAQEQKARIVSLLLRYRGDKPEGAPMVPVRFPATDAEKAEGLRLVTGEALHAQLLAENVLEMEALRLLALWGRGNREAESVLEEGMARLDKLCFASFCHVGECKCASVAFLRLYSAYRPEDWTRQAVMISALLSKREEGALWTVSSGYPAYYSLLALADCQPGMAQSALRACAPAMEALLLYSEHSGPYALVRKHVLRYALSKVAGYGEYARVVFFQDARGRWQAKLPERGEACARYGEAVSQ